MLTIEKTHLTDTELLERGRRAISAPVPLSTKAIGARIIEDTKYNTLDINKRRKLSVAYEDIDFKTLMSTTSGFAPTDHRPTAISTYPRRRTVVSDLIPQDNTRLPSIPFMRQIVETFAAAPTAEGATKPEARFVFEEVTAPLVKIPAWIPVTEEQLADVPGLQSLIDRLLLFQALIAEEDEILNGAGGAGAISGIYTQTGVQQQSKGADTLADAIFKAVSKTEIAAIKAVTDALPNAGALTSLATQASVDTIDDYLDTEVAAIKAKTDNLPASPAAVGSAMTLTSGERNSVADAILDRDMSTGVDSGSTTVRTVRQALRFLRNKWAIVLQVLTVYKEDDSTPSWTSQVSVDSTAEPITGTDPAGP